jgi:hypothetical protein
MGLLEKTSDKKQALIPLTWPASFVWLVLLFAMYKFSRRIERKNTRRERNVCNISGLVV